MGLPGDETPPLPGQSFEQSSNHLRYLIFRGLPQGHGGGISAGVAAGKPKTSGRSIMTKKSILGMKSDEDDKHLGRAPTPRPAD